MAIVPDRQDSIGTYSLVRRLVPVPRRRQSSHNSTFIGHSFGISISSFTMFVSDSSPCFAVNGEGIEYEEFSCIYPSLEGFYFE